MGKEDASKLATAPMSCQLTEGFIKGLKSRETQDRGATNFEDEACLQVSSAAAAGSSSIVALYTHIIETLAFF